MILTLDTSASLLHYADSRLFNRSQTEARRDLHIPIEHCPAFVGMLFLAHMEPVGGPTLGPFTESAAAENAAYIYLETQHLLRV